MIPEDREAYYADLGGEFLNIPVAAAARETKMEELQVVIGEIIEMMSNGRAMPENLNIEIIGRKDSLGVTIDNFGFNDADVDINQVTPLTNVNLMIDVEDID